MTIGSTPPRIQTTNRPVPPIAVSFNDSLPSRNPSGKTLLMILGPLAAGIAFVLLFHSRLGF
jgi:hypothetical protein